MRAIVAIVVPKAGQTVTLEELRGFAGEFLARYSCRAAWSTTVTQPARS